MDSLEQALNANRTEVERALADAERELEELKARQARLEDTIRRAHVVLGTEVAVTAPTPRTGPRRATLPLHEALARVLRSQGNRIMTARELADEVNRLGLYRRGDGTPVDLGQVHARIHNYDRMFIRAGGGIRLRDPETQDVDASALAQFDAAMLEVYAAAMREVRYPARRFLAMVRGRGGLEAARQLLAKHGVSEGFRRLAEAHKLDLTMEYQVLKPEFAALFTDDERATARARLMDHGMREDDLPR